MSDGAPAKDGGPFSGGLRKNVCEILGVPKLGVLKNGWFIGENPINMDDLWVPLFQETSIWLLIIIDEHLHSSLKKSMW